MTEYIALIHQDAEDDYGVSCPDLPGCVTAGATLDEAVRLAAEALAMHLEGLAEDGEVVPEPSSLQAVMTEREHRDAVAFLVAPAAGAAGAVHTDIRLPEALLAELDRAAAAQGVSRSVFLADAARKAMPSAA